MQQSKTYLVFLFTLTTICFKAQVANLVNNGSFESLLTKSTTTTFDVVKFWGPIDTTKNASFLITKHYPYLSSPFSSFGFQYPRTGNNFIITQFFCNTCKRWYPRNRLKQTLKANVTYCAKYYVVSTNNSWVAIDKYGMYFGDNSIDTITQCMSPITYLNPQVENQNGIISDTLNWILVSGTFVATGNEKYVVLGNFRSNAATNTLIMHPSIAVMSSDVYIDDVSVIEVNLPAYAGPDKPFIAGDSVYIGREPDFAIDPGCVWYQLPLSAPIATISGLWVKPVTTTTYVVRQELDCSPLKWDTVVVYQTAVGLNELSFLNENLKIYPVPADDILELKFDASQGAAEKLFEDFNRLSIYNSLGQLVKEEEIEFKEKTLSIDIRDLDAGVYFLTIENNNAQTMPSGTQSTLRQASFSKRFIIQR